MTKRIANKIITIAMSFVVFTSFMPTQSYAEDVFSKRLRDEFSSQVNTEKFKLNSFSYETYENVLTKYPSNVQATTNIDLENITTSDPTEIYENYEGYEHSSLLWNKNTDYVEFTFTAPESAIYQLEADYYLPGRGEAAVRNLQIDGEIPFEEAMGITFLGGWIDEADEPIINNKNDQVPSPQIPVMRWRTTRLCDSKGNSPEPLMLYFEKGEHTIRLDMINGDMILGQVRLVPPKSYKSYSEVLAEYQEKGYTSGGSIGIIQGEGNIIEKSDSTLRPTVNSDVSVTPRSVSYVRLNVIGDWRWRNVHQYITWEFEVPEDGLYKVGLRYLQWWNDGIASFRQIAIDGEVPYKEFFACELPYTREWTTNTLSNSEDEPYLIYLEKGKHTITLTTKLGGVSKAAQSLMSINSRLSDMILGIVMVTGSNPDVNYEYELDKKIPTLLTDLDELLIEVDSVKEYIATISSKNSALANSLNLLSTQITTMRKNPESIPRRLNDLKNSLNGISDWYINIQYQPIILDYIEITGSDEKIHEPKASFFDKLGGMIENLAYSFVKDYDNVGDIQYGENNEDSVPVNETITVWVGRGKEWAEQIKMLADMYFTPKEGIAIKMNVLPASQLSAGAVNALMLAISSGKDVDVALSVSQTSPVEFAIRNSVVDLSKFDGYEETAGAMLPAALIPFEYEGGIYGLPETMNFTCMFYRKDIMENLGLTIPDTWAELYQYVLPTLTRNNLQFYYPEKNFGTFLFQNGGEFYSENNTQTGLGTTEAFSAFKEYTELFTHYGVPRGVSFYNRFRTGEIPMGIGTYTDYMFFKTAAPELVGKWGIAPIPGHIDENGNINRSFPGTAGEADIIIANSKKQDESWKFLQWWLSEETQLRYAREIEAIVGASARWNTSNAEVFNNLPWGTEDISVIESQWQWATDIPTVLGGYFTSRHVDNAWGRVVVSGVNVRDSLEMAILDINTEMRMKQEEYNNEQKE